MSLPPRSNTPVGEQSVDPQLLQSMLVALTNLQMQIANQSGETSRDPNLKPPNPHHHNIQDRLLYNIQGDPD